MVLWQDTDLLQDIIFTVEHRFIGILLFIIILHIVIEDEEEKRSMQYYFHIIANIFYVSEQCG